MTYNPDLFPHIAETFREIASTTAFAAWLELPALQHLDKSWKLLNSLLPPETVTPTSVLYLPTLSYPAVLKLLWVPKVLELPDGTLRIPCTFQDLDFFIQGLGRAPLLGNEKRFQRWLSLLSQ